MIDDYIQQIYDVFRNITLNTMGVKRDLYQLMLDKDVERAISMFADHDKEIDKAVAEYNPQTHAVMKRRNKFRKGDSPYITEKLPRTWQRYINEVELFFLLGNPVKWKKLDGDDEAYQLFTDFLQKTRFDSKIRQLKRLAGAETEAALMFHLYQEGGERKFDNWVVARSKGFTTRSLFDQYGNLVAMAYGYKIKSGTRDERHWDVQTSEWIFECTRDRIGWNVEIFPNPTGKINGIFARQPKAWDGAVPRIERDEMLDSKIADTNNYFSDPIASATADVINSLKSEDRVARMVQLTNGNSRFEYVNPPQNSEARREEKDNLRRSILSDTFTPDLSFEALKGFGTLTGAALKNALVLGYMKRAMNLEVWDDLVDRYKNVLIEVLAFLHPDKAELIRALKVKHEFSDPFAADEQGRRQSISQLYTSGLISLDTAVALLAMVDAPEEEVERIKAATVKPSSNE